MINTWFKCSDILYETQTSEQKKKLIKKKLLVVRVKYILYIRFTTMQKKKSVTVENIHLHGFKEKFWR